MLGLSSTGFADPISRPMPFISESYVGYRVSFADPFADVSQHFSGLFEKIGSARNALSKRQFPSRVP